MALKQGTFDTGRQYSPAGQIIEWKLVEAVEEADFLGFDVTLAFHDAARGVSAVTRGWVPHLTHRDLEAAVLRGYDSPRGHLDILHTEFAAL